MDMKLIRNPTTAQGTIIFRFDTAGYEFLVKNFTDGDVYASLREGATKENSVLIPAGCAQVLLINIHTSNDSGSSAVQIIAKSASDKGVEVQCIRY